MKTNYPHQNDSQLREKSTKDGVQETLESLKRRIDARIEEIDPAGRIGDVPGAAVERALRYEDVSRDGDDLPVVGAHRAVRGVVYLDLVDGRDLGAGTGRQTERAEQEDEGCNPDHPAPLCCA